MTFKGIHPCAWQHPADSVALKMVKKVPGLDIALKTFLGGTSERSLRLMALASSVRVTDKQFPRLNQLLDEACMILDVENKPELFVAQNPFLNAGAVGVDHPFITLNSSIVESTTDEELLGIIGHELGHILSGHVLYKTLLQLMIRFSTMVMSIPLSGVAIYGIIAALLEWDRKSELTADRAELLVVQDPEVAVSMHMKLAGGKNTKEMNLGEFIKQAEEYESKSSMVDNFYKVSNLLWQSHPFGVLRVNELIKWVQSGEYETILRGNYPTEETEFKEAADKATDEYAQSFRDTVKPVTESFEQAQDKAKEIFNLFFSRPENKN